MRVIVTGSRDWEGILAEEKIGKVLNRVLDLSTTLGSKLTIVHGGCPTGADAIADRWARRRLYEPEVHEANWGMFGRAAGPMRNGVMAGKGGDMCLAFRRGENSRGTLDMIKQAKMAGIPTFVVEWGDWGLYGE